MTREETLRWLNNLIKGRKDPRGDNEIDTALKEAVKIIEQEPCEDLINRKELDEALYERFHEEDSPKNITVVFWGEVRNFIKNFPSTVNPQELKTDVLDKIRAEIEQEYKVESEHPYGQGLRRALEIIDKYKAETE